MYSTFQLRNTLKERAREFIFDAVANRNPRRLGLITTYPGSGKSYSIWDVLMESIIPSHHRFAYLAPRHNIILEMCDVDHRCSIPHLISRNHIKDGVPVCKYLQDNPKAADYVKRGEIIASIFCNQCKHASRCEHINNMRRVQNGASWTGVHAHMSAFTDILFSKIDRERYDIIVIDENPFQTMLQSSWLTMGRMRHLLTMFDGWGAPTRFVSACGQVLIGGKPPDIKAEGFSSREFLREYTERAKTTVELGGRLPPYNMVSIIGRIIEDVGNGVPIERMVTMDKERVRLLRFDSTMIDRLGVPILALDATGSKDTWQALAPSYNVEIVLNEDWRHYNVIHLKGSGNFYLKTWKSCDEHHPNFRLLRLVSQLSSKNVIVCSSKKIREIISSNLDDCKNIRHAIFMALTSDNTSWPEASTLVIAGRPTLPPDERAAMVLATGLSNDVIDYLTIEAEVQQAIGRLRQSIPETTEFHGKGVFDTRKVKRDGLYIIVMPDLGKDDPFKGFGSYDSDALVHVKRDDYLECLANGYLDPVAYYGGKMLGFLVVPRTMTEIKREFKNKMWIERSLARLLTTNQVKKVGQRWVVNFETYSGENHQQK